MGGRWPVGRCKVGERRFEEHGFQLQGEMQTRFVRSKGNRDNRDRSLSALRRCVLAHDVG
jgi:hypothetical protein